MSSGKNSLKVLKYSKSTSAKLKIFRKNSTKNGQNSIWFWSTQYTNSRHSVA